MQTQPLGPTLAATPAAGPQIPKKKRWLRLGVCRGRLLPRVSRCVLSLLRSVGPRPAGFGFGRRRCSSFDDLTTMLTATDADICETKHASGEDDPYEDKLWRAALLLDCMAKAPMIEVVSSETPVAPELHC